MSMRVWAENEVRIAVAKELNADPDDRAGFFYAAGCYQSALKAYMSLMEDEHSGMSFSITKDILVRLLNGKPLTPIYDTPNIWSEIEDNKEDKSVCYQCTRMPSLFKTVYEDGTVKYSDYERYYGIDPDDKNAIPFHGCGMTKLLDEYFPITMPYIPENGKYRIEVKEYLTDRKNGDFDTMAYLNIVTPDEKVVPINRYFAFEDNGMKEITANDFDGRVYDHILREAMEEAEKNERSGKTDPD